MSHLHHGWSTSFAKVMIVDDHPVTREGLAVRLDVESDLQVCGNSNDVEEAHELAAKTKPDVAVIDVALNTGNGIELIKVLNAQDSLVRMLVWSMHEELVHAEPAYAPAQWVTSKRRMQAVRSSTRFAIS